MKKFTNFLFLGFLSILFLIVFSPNSVHATPIESLTEIDSNKTYIIYDTSTDNCLFDDNGNNEGWLRYSKFDYNQKYSFKITKNGNYYNLTNISTTYNIKAMNKSIDDKLYLVSDKSGSEEVKNFSLIKKDNGFILKDTNDKYITLGQDRNYVTLVSDENAAKTFIIEETPSYDFPVGSTSLWQNPDGNNYYRIPAITTTNTGRIIAVTDYRFNHDSDLGNHKIHLHVKHSDDNGKTWSENLNITPFNGGENENIGYGDAAIIADRESNTIVILCAYGTQGYWHADRRFVSTRNNPIRVARFVSTDNGNTFSEPEDISNEFYNKDVAFQRLFVASGRIMQSRYIKKGDYYRIYTSILEGARNANFVLYSDNLGKSWHILGDASSPVPGGNEAKIEELPNGNVIISSRTGNGRFINLFKYNEDDPTKQSGTWEDRYQKLTLGNGSSCNGEILFTYVKEKETGKYTYLALQSLPALNNRRDGVSIYYKEINKDIDSVDKYIENWNPDDFYMVQPKSSAYSTMTVQNDGNIGFLYEDRYITRGYDIQYIPLSIETITKGKFTNAFTGIGTKASPYIADSKEANDAIDNIYNNEKVYFKYLESDENKEAIDNNEDKEENNKDENVKYDNDTKPILNNKYTTMNFNTKLNDKPKKKILPKTSCIQ